MIFLLINLSKSQIRSFTNILMTRTFEDNLKYLKYTLLLLIISLFFYSFPAIDPLMQLSSLQSIKNHFPNHQYFFQNISFIFTIFSILIFFNIYFFSKNCLQKK